MTTVLFIIAIIAGFAVLIWGADRFVDGAANIATNFGVSPLIVGLTIVGFGTSAPEMLVSALASFDGAPALGIGNALGSNIANVGLVLGITILITPLAVHSDTLKREFPMLAFVMAVALFLLWDQYLGYMDGIILFSGFILTLFGMAYLAMRSGKSDPLKQEFNKEFSKPKMTTKQSILSFIIGLIALLSGSKSLVWGATGVATLLGVSDLIIGLTIVAIGTSLPELAASVISALKHEHDIAIGNILGSNMFNLLAVLAMPGLIQPSQVESALLYRDFPFMVGLFVMLFLFAHTGQKNHIGRVAGSALLLVYITYNSLLAYQSTTGIPV
ncbi:MAG: calcium/sodium antiporter [Gammaproteobacteria bacterium]|nr:calcium/sodium antiporter [Gammaproteobacteria bacterium]MDH5591636.1 calcium/sodium antiporter [Gammaproteobacteria bacterium]